MTRFARHSFALAKRNLIGVVRNPEALIDVTLQPIIFVALFTYIFGGAIANGSQHDYLQFLLPGILAQTIAFGGIAIGVNLNSDIEKGVFDRFRSLPIARAAPLVGAVLGDIVRYTLLCVVTLGFGYILGFRFGTSFLEVFAACLLAIGFALCLCWTSVFVGMIARTPGAVQGILMLLLFPLTFTAGIFVPSDTLPELAGVGDQRQPAHAPGRRPARPDARRPGGQRRALDAGLDGLPAGGLRPARATCVRAPRLRAGRRPPRRRAPGRGRRRRRTRRRRAPVAAPRAGG